MNMIRLAAGGGVGFDRRLSEKAGDFDCRRLSPKAKPTADAALSGEAERITVLNQSLF